MFFMWDNSVQCYSGRFEMTLDDFLISRNADIVGLRKVPNLLPCDFPLLKYLIDCVYVCREVKSQNLVILKRDIRQMWQESRTR